MSLRRTYDLYCSFQTSLDIGVVSLEAVTDQRDSRIQAMSATVARHDLFLMSQSLPLVQTGARITLLHLTSAICHPPRFFFVGESTLGSHTVLCERRGRLCPMLMLLGKTSMTWICLLATGPLAERHLYNPDTAEFLYNTYCLPR